MSPMYTCQYHRLPRPSPHTRSFQSHQNECHRNERNSLQSVADTSQHPVLLQLNLLAGLWRICNLCDQEQETLRYTVNGRYAVDFVRDIYVLSHARGWINWSLCPARVVHYTNDNTRITNGNRSDLQSHTFPLYLHVPQIYYGDGLMLL